MKANEIRLWIPAIVTFAVVIGGWYDSQNALVNLANADERLKVQLKDHIVNVNKIIEAHDVIDVKSREAVDKSIDKLQLDAVQQARIEERQKSLQKDGDRREKKLNIIINQLSKMRIIGDK